jgi:hypothetical protein
VRTAPPVSTQKLFALQYCKLKVTGAITRLPVGKAEPHPTLIYPIQVSSVKYCRVTRRKDQLDQRFPHHEGNDVLVPLHCGNEQHSKGLICLNARIVAPPLPRHVIESFGQGDRIKSFNKVRHLK